MPEISLELNRMVWDAVGPSMTATALPHWGPLATPEDELKLLGDIREQRVLELGCGGGHSLLWLAAAGATELWGFDISRNQLIAARQTLDARQVQARLIHSSFEHAAGLPAAHFDLAVSVFALGWAMRLDAALARIAGCLRPGGRLVFSWEHPFFSLLAERNGEVIVAAPYRSDGRPRRRAFQGAEVALILRSLGDWTASVLRAGLVLEALVEPSLNERQLTDHHHEPGYVYSLAKARRVPTTFVIAARKPG